MTKELKVKMVGVRLTKSTNDFITEKAKNDDRSVSYIIEKILTGYVQQKKLLLDK